LWANPTCQGNLLKKGHVRKNWKWRWFRLQDTNLFYFQTREEGERPLGHIDLTHYRVKKTPTVQRQYGFGLYSPQLPSYPLAAIDQHDFNKWLTNLKLATKGTISTTTRDPALNKSYNEGLPDDTNNNNSNDRGNRPRNRSSSSGDIRIPNYKVIQHKKHLSMTPLRPKQSVIDQDSPNKEIPYDIDHIECFSDDELNSGKKNLVDQTYGSSEKSKPYMRDNSVSPDDQISLVSSAPAIMTDINRFGNANPPVTSPRSHQFIRIKSPRDKNRDSRNFSEKKQPQSNPTIDLSGLKSDGDQINKDETGAVKRLTTINIEEEFEIRSPVMSPRGVEVLRQANTEMNGRRISRSSVLMDSIMEEISEETIVIDPTSDAQNYSDKMIWRAIRRSILPSPDLLSQKVKGGHHRGQLTPQEIALIAEDEEKERLRKLKDLYINPQDPLLKYNILNRSIGKGAVGEVFFATDKATDTKVAIKKLQIERRGRDRLPLILREIDIIATSSHENIVSFFEAYHMEGELWVVMEFMSNGSLYDLVKLNTRGVRIDEPIAAYCIREVVKAIEFLHFRKRIHRDIKVDNILVNRDGSVKLADFGTAVQLTFQRLRRTTLAGTPYYMAPELIQRIPYNEKVDIWSIGITVVELLNGKPPFYELDPREALDAIVLRGVKGLTEAKHTDLVKNFVNIHCLNSNPAERDTATQLLEHAFISTACTKEQFARFLLQSNALYQIEDTGTSTSGCTIL
jgi:hypothetical protein